MRIWRLLVFISLISESISPTHLYAHSIDCTKVVLEVARRIPQRYFYPYYPPYERYYSSGPFFEMDSYRGNFNIAPMKLEIPMASYGTVKLLSLDPRFSSHLVAVAVNDYLRISKLKVPRFGLRFIGFRPQETIIHETKVPGPTMIHELQNVHLPTPETLDNETYERPFIVFQNANSIYTAAITKQGLIPVQQTTYESVPVGFERVGDLYFLAEEGGWLHSFKIDPIGRMKPIANVFVGGNIKEMDATGPSEGVYGTIYPSKIEIIRQDGEDVFESIYEFSPKGKISKVDDIYQGKAADYFEEDR